MTKIFVQNSIGNRFDKINHEKIKNLVSQMAVFTTAFKNRLFPKIKPKIAFSNQKLRCSFRKLQARNPLNLSVFMC